jgi:hypothetical protein
LLSFFIFIFFHLAACEFDASADIKFRGGMPAVPAGLGTSGGRHRAEGGATDPQGAISLGPVDRPFGSESTGPSGRDQAPRRERRGDQLTGLWQLRPGPGNTHSDIDLLVDLATGLRGELERLLEAGVDLIPADSLNDGVRQNAVQEMVSL